LPQSFAVEELGLELVVKMIFIEVLFSSEIDLPKWSGNE
jgi:hypothetical protein